MNITIKRSSTMIGALAAIVMGTGAKGQNSLEEITVVGESQLVESSITLEGDALKVANTGDILNWVPGANINRNGPLTALPQYRGASGDRINVEVDGMTLFTGGPNAMDAPISSVPGSNLKTLSVSRGIASVSAAQETLGGHIAVSTQRGDFAEGGDINTQLRATTLYNDNDQGVHSSVLGVVANDRHKTGVAYSYQEGDDKNFADGDIPNTFFRRNRVSGFYGLKTDSATLNLDVTRVATEGTGTASLPMDIDFIDADTVGIDAGLKLGETQLHFMLGTQDIEHRMSNYDYRPNPVPANHRANFATGEHDHAKFGVKLPVSSGTVALGLDYSDALHNADISNPNNPMFQLANFNDVTKTLTGFYAEWVAQSGVLSWELGARFNQWETDAGNVIGPMMVTPLAVQFNSSDRERDDNNTDLVAKFAYQASSHAIFSFGIAQKSRTPSYQELYLWAPLQSTGGLADGRNYVGNLQLESETAQELNLGMDVNRSNINLSMQIFYRQVDDYIQGTPEINLPNAMQVNMISTMMSGNPALQFNNVDAVLYGADLGYAGKFAGNWYYRGNLNYVRGKRDDIKDDLYRIAPLNHSLTIGALFADWDLSLTSELVSKQKHVSSYNNEQPTGGYGLVHVDARWQLAEQMQIVVGVDNLLDKKYALHLNGYNRVALADVGVGERIPGMGRNARVGVSYHF